MEICWGFKIAKNKAFEIQFGKWPWEDSGYFDFSFRWNKKCDHAGISLSFEIFGLHLYFQLYDTRHWDDDKNKWHDPKDRLAQLANL